MQLRTRQGELIVDTLRITRRQWTQILADLERKRGDFRLHEKRREPRWRCPRVEAVLVELTHPGGTRSFYLARWRDCSAHGLGFLHGQFIHPGSRAAATLLTADGQAVAVCGRITHCRLVEGRVHEVGLAFDQPINVALVGPPSPAASAP